MIDIKHLSITFDRVIFDDASITLSNNSITMIKGKSGTGKTTLLNQLGLVAPLACDYLMEGHSIDDPLTTRKEKIGYVHQVIIRKEQHRQSHKVHHLYHQLHH